MADDKKQADPAPTNGDEFMIRFHRNQKIEGFGTGTQMVVPCPFCAAPRFAVWNIFELATTDNEPMRRDRTCAECGRSSKILIVREAGATTGELVQTGGDDPPPWMNPKPRRV